LIYVVMGMYYSGTTLVAKTLHESGVDMDVTCNGPYWRCKYESFDASAICVSALGVDRIDDLEVPETVDVRHMMRWYVGRRAGDDWGFKHPAVTLCYGQWCDVLPPHIAIGVRRTPTGLMEHFARKGGDVARAREVQAIYNERMESYGVPVVWYEDLMENGMGALEAIVGRDLVDARVFDRRVRDGG